MEGTPVYNLLQAIDPTKIRIPISDRFAKLTLSSNKKREQAYDEPAQKEDLKRQQEKRSSVSRNISKQFTAEDKENQQKLENPLLRSESSAETECNNSVHDNADEFTMEPLEVSEEYENATEFEDDLEVLTQQISSMALDPKSISLSSGSTCNISILTELFSSESQRSSTGEVNNIHIVHNIPVNVKEALRKETIPIHLTSLTTENPEKIDEISEDQSDEEENEIITVSDTTGSNQEQEPNIMTTSSLPVISPTEQLRLPSLTDDKAKRVADFLRDVSFQRRAMDEHSDVEFDDTIDRILENKEVDKIQDDIAKSRRIATADTESMTPDIGEEITPNSVVEREKRLQAFDEFKENEQIIHKKCETDDELQVYKPRKSDQSEAKILHNLTIDDTLDNSVMTKSDGQNKVERTPKKHTNLKNISRHFTPETPKGAMKDAYRIANDETQCNTPNSICVATSTNFSSNKNQVPHNSSNSRAMANFETQDNTQCSSIKMSSKNKNQYSAGNVDADNSADLWSDLDDNLGVANIPQQFEKSKKSCKPAINDEIGNNSSMSIHSTTPSKEESTLSFLNSSAEVDESALKHSITILETDDDDLVPNSDPRAESCDDQKLSNSFQREDSSDDSEYEEPISNIQMSMANINISAKINIRIHIPNINTTEKSENKDLRHEKRRKESSQLQSKESIPLENEHHSTELNKDSLESCQSKHMCNQMQLKHPIREVLYPRNKTVDLAQHEQVCEEIEYTTRTEENASSTNKSSPPVDEMEDENFVAEAEKLLTNLYGKSWQTPEVMRTLKRSTQSDGNKSNNSKYSLRKECDGTISNEKKSNAKSAADESLLDDFSIFRRNVVKTNLDSTRLRTPKSVEQNIKFLTEPRNCKKSTPKEKMSVKRVPRKERNVYDTPAAKVNKRQVVTGKWRHMIDSDSNSECDNASDDEDADESWSKNGTDLELETSDTDYEILPRRTAKTRKNNTTKRQSRSDKSNHLMKVLNKSKPGEIVYLDLSKDEVAVQDEVPESPPANEDANFATRLQDILRTCRHEDRNKLTSSNKKTKRKLFTPNFGEDGTETALPKEGEANPKASYKTYNDEILLDNGICPFDSQGRSKVLDVVNKQVESVKQGKPIFQITPQGKNAVTTAFNSIGKNIKSDNVITPKAKPDDPAKFKTPQTVKSRIPPKFFTDLGQTPDFKYSFLKSLDVTVSKTFCHPDALYYRENYRTKKEDLAKILFDMYNERLFENKLEVPIVWNKKLLNTAGRCLNKKKLGIKSSTIELSDKVLTSADRLRCTLIHELCHAATWIFSGEGGHGSAWKEWARKANATFPEIPKIGVCHQYDIEYKYTYKCTLCAAKSHAHSKSKKVENIRCSYCHGAIEIFLNKKDKDGNVLPTPVKEPTGFAKFVKDNYKKFKRDDLKHADVMKLLSSEFASLKVG